MKNHCIRKVTAHKKNGQIAKVKEWTIKIRPIKT